MKPDLYCCSMCGKMETLPDELIDHLCSYLSISSLKSFRCTCKTFAEIGEKHLFNDFEFRLVPNHRRLYQLKQLAAHSTIAPRLRCLAYESGVQLEYADFRYWQAQVYQDISKARAMNIATKGSSEDEYENFHATLQARFTTDMPRRYDLYRWHLDQEAASMAERGIQNALLRTMNALAEHNPGLHLKLVMLEPQITLEELEAFHSEGYASNMSQDPDPRRRVFQRRKNCLSHFINFIEAALISDLQVQHLVAVDIPHQLLTIDSIHGSDVLDETFRGLHSLEIKVSSFAHSDWLSRGGLHEVYFGGRDLAANRLARLLNQPANLEFLQLQFPEGKEAEYSFDIFDRTNIDRFPRLWLSHLRRFSLCHFRCTWFDLQALFQAVRKVESMILSHCRLETGSMLDVVHFISTMKLTSIAIEGKWYVDEDSGEWHSHSEDNFTDCFASTSYEGPYISSGMRSRVEHFMLVGGKCPLPTWTSEGREELVWEVEGDTSWHYLPGLPRV